jgi:glycosyltransferase involved in cell wall biosynthesis
MRIVLAHEYYQQPGGEDMVFRLEQDLLRARGHDVTTYTAHNRDLAAMGRIAMARATIWNRSVRDDLANTLRRRRVDVLHVHNTLPLLSPSVYYAGRAAGVAVVQTLHNYRPVCANGLLLRGGVPCEDCVGSRVPWRAVRHACYRNSRVASAAVATMAATHGALGTWRTQVDAYVAPSEFTRRKFVQAGLDGDRIHVKPHFVSPDPGIGTGAGGYAIYVGRLSQEKGILTLIRAWQQLNGAVPLVLVGDGPLVAGVTRFAADVTNVRWLGRTDPSRVYELIGSARCAIVPSECYETFGRVAIEAFAKGTPVIGADIGALSEIVADGKTGFRFRPGDSGHLAAVVTRLFGQPAAQMRQAARSAFDTAFSADRNYERLMTIYQGAIRLARAADGASSRATTRLSPNRM